ncbi:acyl transferase domain-containing protein [Mycena albidolilacea]|uniref:Acyl transferase domain-containing protein n=1 Tax=Mycena albidolilacea TaxID=1033008 RepID=A0AAD7AN26_9AGAR|nr:acyl transferase domain-containing protein [Mycena albidolilacea]
MISLSSFGIGGANAHVVLEGPAVHSVQTVQNLSQAREDSILLMAAGLTPRTAGAVADHIASAFNNFPLEARNTTAIVLGRRSKQMLWRTYAVISDAHPAVEFLPAALSPREPGKIVFVFSGQGPQYRDMGRELFKIFPTFKQNVLEMDAMFTDITQKSLIHDYGLFDGQVMELGEPWSISLILPAITVFQIALYELLLSLNIKPDILVGHSAGETAVLYASGAASKDMAVELSIIRGRALSAIESAGGSMAALSCSAEQAVELISTEAAANPDSVVEIACYNSPSDVAIAGHIRALQRIVGVAAERGILARMIRTTVPIHSSMINSCRQVYEAGVTRLFERFPGPHMPSLKTVSTLTGMLWETSYDAEYFWNNTRKPVHFTAALETISASDPNLTFVEISAHPVLSSYISTTLNKSSAIYCPVRRPKLGHSPSESIDLLTFCGRLTMDGHNCVDFAALHGNTFGPIVKLPAYPFVKKSFPLYPDTPGVVKQMASRRGPLNHDYLRINKTTHPLLAEHVIRGEPIMPAAGFLEMAIEFGASTLMNVNFRSLLALSSATPIRVKVALDGCHWSVTSVPTISSSRTASLPSERLHADGYLSFEEPKKKSALDIPAIRARCPKHVGADFYASLSYFSSYGPRFQRTMHAFYGHREALVSIKGLDRTLKSDGYILHPAVLDACFHMSAYKPFHGDLNPDIYYLPSGVQKLVLHRPWKKDYFPVFLQAHIQLELWTPEIMIFDIVVVDDRSVAVCSVVGLQVSRHRINQLPHVFKPFDRLNTKSSFIFDYVFGREIALQWYFSGLNVLQKLDVWVLADHPAALGLTRAIRFEYPSWNIRLVLFPPSFPAATRRDIVQKLPYSARHEPELLISQAGETLVSRLVPFHQLPRHDPLRQNLLSSDSRCCSLTIAGTTGFIAEAKALVTDTEKTWVMGLVPDTNPGQTAQFLTIPETLVTYQLRAIEVFHALVSAILALNQASVLIPTSTLRILLTHSDTSYGQAIEFLFSARGHEVTRIPESILLSELATVSEQDFDLVISGYSNQEHVQILKLLARPLATVFLWNFPGQGVSTALKFVPSMFLNGHTQALCSSPFPTSPSIGSNGSVSLRPNPLIFSQEGYYLLIGGIGHVGARIALYLYQNGARHIVTTSRSGKAGVLKAATAVRRLFEYLDGFSDLLLQCEAIDATSQMQMQVFTERMEIPLRGCFILTSTLSDGTFASLRDKDFEHSFVSKISVLETLQRTVNISSLDFLVAFSSVSGTFGNAGQSAYDATNTALEYMIEKIPNAFSFICPGLLDSSMLLDHGNLPRTLIPWSISTEEMILWLQDALYRHLHGARFHRYLPALDWGALDSVHGMPKLGAHLVPSPDPWATDLVTLDGDEPGSIRKVVQESLNIPPSDFADNLPLTAYGIDSLSASRISFLLRPFIQISQIQLLADITLNDIFGKLGRPVLSLEGGDPDQTEFHASNSKDGGLRRWLDTMNDLCPTLTPSVADSISASGLNTVVVTGTTGVLGAHVLQELLLRSDVCLDGAGRPLLMRQTHAFSRYGIDTSLLASSKLVLVESDLGSESWGIPSESRDQISSRVTHIIHNAWNINFGAPLVEFDTLIRGTLNLLRLAEVSKASFSFVSTIGVYQGTQLFAPAPERPIDQFPIHLPSGYLQSKWLAERLVQMASDVWGVSSNVIRIGLLTGAANGYWDVSHWLPTLVESGLHVGCLPDGDGIVSWIPVGLAARAILDFHQLSNETVHLVHPRPITWTWLISLIAADLNLVLVPYSEWLARLEYAAKSSFQSGSTTAPNQIAAVKLLDFYRIASHTTNEAQGVVESLGFLPVVVMEKGLHASASLGGATPLTAHDVETWMLYWRSVETFPRLTLD